MLTGRQQQRTERERRALASLSGGGGQRCSRCWPPYRLSRILNENLPCASAGRFASADPAGGWNFSAFVRLRREGDQNNGSESGRKRNKR